MTLGCVQVRAVIRVSLEDALERQRDAGPSLAEAVAAVAEVSINRCRRKGVREVSGGVEMTFSLSIPTDDMAQRARARLTARAIEIDLVKKCGEEGFAGRIAWVDVSIEQKTLTIDCEEEFQEAVSKMEVRWSVDQLAYFGHKPAMPLY